MAGLQLVHTDSTNKSNLTIVYNNNYSTGLKPFYAAHSTMPDVKGMTLKDALYVLEDIGMKVFIKGRGKVIAQDKAAGSAINKNETITLLLSQ